MRAVAAAASRVAPSANRSAHPAKNAAISFTDVIAMRDAPGNKMEAPGRADMLRSNSDQLRRRRPEKCGEPTSVSVSAI